MSFVSVTSQATTPPPPAPASGISSADVMLLMMGAVAGASMSKAARRQYRQLRRKLVWQALGQKFKSMFSKKHRFGDTVAGMDMWLFILLAVVAAAIGVWLFGLFGFLVILGLATIIYLLLRN
ncbi:MAG: hypothetical protein MUF62_04160 [Chitinophagaceae bacterium]|nr:hypothetical protein [Chitinophagaceae bacterium]